MKKYYSGIIALAFAFAASAFSTSSSETKGIKDTQYHWFDSQTGDYLGLRTITAQDALCPGSGAACADAYTGKTAGNQPSGSFVTTVQKQ